MVTTRGRGFILEGAFDRRGCDFKVLVSPGVHPLVCGDSQSCDLNGGEGIKQSDLVEIPKIETVAAWKIQTW